MYCSSNPAMNEVLMQCKESACTSSCNGNMVSVTFTRHCVSEVAKEGCVARIWKPNLGVRKDFLVEKAFLLLL